MERSGKIFVVRMDRIDKLLAAYDALQDRQNAKKAILDATNTPTPTIRRIMEEEENAESTSN